MKSTRMQDGNLQFMHSSSMANDVIRMQSTRLSICRNKDEIVIVDNTAAQRRMQATVTSHSIKVSEAPVTCDQRMTPSGVIHATWLTGPQRKVTWLNITEHAQNHLTKVYNNVLEWLNAGYLGRNEYPPTAEIILFTTISNQCVCMPTTTQHPLNAAIQQTDTN